MPKELVGNSLSIAKKSIQNERNDDDESNCNGSIKDSDNPLEILEQYTKDAVICTS